MRHRAASWTLVGLYAGLVLQAGHVLPVRDSIAVAGATLVVAALFSPVRRRAQHVAQADLSASVDRALQPAHLSLWTTS